MLLAGDELGRTQKGNNNAYCQDNEVSWIDWQNADRDLLEFTKKLINLSNSHPVFCRKRWFQGQRIRGTGVDDIAWFLPDGSEMTEEHWNTYFAKSLAVYLNGYGIHYLDPKGVPIIDDSFYVIFNAHYGSIDYKLPPAKYGETWIKTLDTALGKIENMENYGPEETISVKSRSVVLLKHPTQR
jgi:glycogen operon protein